ncbi:MAG TPA: gliding motility-associated C-terminal domain-containing protein [Cyclobacteriaceae bacterium]|nr:gliding motility-associated C-terminal domain-containing protein [Cyclobacteriaceae bacterium]
MSISSIAFSQDMHNGTSIFVPDSIGLYFDDLDNKGFIQNNGTIGITGDWVNQNVYQGLGTVVLSGTNQDIDNNNQAMQDLLVLGGGTKSLDGKLIINGSIDFVSGIVKVGKGDMLLIGVDGTIEGGSASSFVDGPLTTVGTGYKFFPVGRNGAYYPLTLTDIRGLDPVMQVTAFEDLPEITTSRNVEVDHSAYWTQQAITGSYDGSPVIATHHFDEEDAKRIVVVAGNDFAEEFVVILSKDPVTLPMIAIGKLPVEPVMPAYLSTTMSPHAQMPDNRLVKIFGSEMSSLNFSFRVFNRWGSLLFESKSLPAMMTDGWDGKHNGQLLPAGAYPYFLGYVDQEGREGRKTGFITIVY